MKNPVKAIREMVNPLAAYRAAVIRAATGETVPDDEIDRLCEATVRTRAHWTCDVARRVAAEDSKQRRDRFQEILRIKPAARQAIQMAEEEFRERLRPIKAEYDAKVAELHQPVNEAIRAYQAMEEEERNCRSDMSSAKSWPDQDLLRKADETQRRCEGLRVETERITREIERIGTYRRSLQRFGGLKPDGYVPAWHPARNWTREQFSDRMSKPMLESERAAALAWIEREEAKVPDLRKRLQEIPAEIAEIVQRAGEIRSQAHEADRFSLSEMGDPDLERLVPKQKRYSQFLHA